MKDKNYCHSPTDPDFKVWQVHNPGWKTCMNFPTRSCERLDLARCELRADPKSHASCCNVESTQLKLMRLRVSYILISHTLKNTNTK